MIYGLINPLSMMTMLFIVFASRLLYEYVNVPKQIC